MPSSLRQALDIIRENSSSDVEMGTKFEKLSKIFLEHDATQAQQFSQVWHYSDWAQEHGYQKKDIGIDLVAKNASGEGFCAIQCKFYKSDNTIKKEDLDSFISASSTPDFTRLLLIDTSNKPIGRNAQAVFDKLDKEYNRIQLQELEESRIDWLTYVREDRVRLSSKKDLRDHQIQALKAIKDGLAEDDRGKMIMACGTGKTFTSLRIAEDLAGKGKCVLYMVPSLALMSQTVREWKNDALEDFTAFSACSDQKVGKRRGSDDVVEMNLHDLAFPATTDAKKLSEQIAEADKDKMTVVFSTYHSIDVISQAQHEHGLPEFDLIVCDEAHRTTGATLAGDDESNFVRIHNNENVIGKKRLYMTATPRIYSEKARNKAEGEEATLASMDDENIYGKVLFHRNFGWAVENNLLTDYKVIVLAVDEGIVSQSVQRSFEDGVELKLDDATKMVGCYKALAKVGFENSDGEEVKLPPMRRALAFCQNIALSKMFSEEFMGVVDNFLESEEIDEKHKTDLKVELHHVDGTFNAEQRNEKLGWLKDDTEENICRVLTNARCLSEGVDVPALDAIMFLHPRKSQIDIVQSVGRVMRKAEGKDLGYVILPITVAPGVSPERALNDNKKYEVVWQILNALRAHDERFDGMINRLGLGEDVSDHLEIVGVGGRDEADATTAVIDDIKPKPKKGGGDDTGDGDDDDDDDNKYEDGEEQLAFVLTELSSAIKAKIVKNCGTRDYWENWASDIAKIAEQHIKRINAILVDKDTPAWEAFSAFLEEIRDDLNPEITSQDAVEMLAQHMITRPVFNTLFRGNRFTEENAVSKAMETVLDRLYEKNVDAEAGSDSLKKFYASVERRASDINTAFGRQQLILELYDRFFRNAFPLMTQKLGIVYTPTEVVDFIIHSVEDVLKDEFGTSLGDKGVHILDPFTGTGTFISRLLQSGIISKQDLPYKYKNEIHANEIVLLAYYIACINIEAVYDDLAKENQYQPFNGMVLTDTFQLYEQERDMIADLLPDNSKKRTAQKERDITVVIGNPPYSAGQGSANDNAANVAYANLDQRIERTYAAATNTTNKNSLYDSYIRAFRWASDRIGDEGVIGFVTNAGWIDGNATDGLRKCLKDEFSSAYVFHLRGNARTKGEERRKEKGNVFGEGSRTPIAITILVKNKSSDQHGQIYFHDIGDYLDQKQKLGIIQQFGSIKGISEHPGWQLITPDEDNDWVNQGEKSFARFLPLGNKKSDDPIALFGNYSRGLATGRDAWCYNFNKNKLIEQMSALTANYNHEIIRFAEEGFDLSDKSQLNFDPAQISWNRGLLDDFRKGRHHKVDRNRVYQSLYRPFCKCNSYFDRPLNDMVYQNYKIFPEPDTQNLVIAVTGLGAGVPFACFMTDVIPNLHTMDTGQCFPLKLYEQHEGDADGLFANEAEDGLRETDAITDEGLQHFLDAYPGESFSKEDLFYYVYGLLHSTDYRDRFANNLSKELPRIPAVKRFEDFMAFSKAGRKLSKFHVDYESVDPYQVSFKEGDLRLVSSGDPKAFYRVEKMKFAGKRPNLDKTTVIYNNNITMQNVPLEAYDYVVNGKPALEWVMDRQCVSTDKKSGITNDANDYANETMNNPAYPLELFQRVITVSLETMKIVRGLPKLDID